MESKYYTDEEVMKMFDLDESQLKLLLQEDDTWKNIHHHRERGRIYFDRADVDKFREKIFTEPTIPLDDGKK